MNIKVTQDGQFCYRESDEEPWKVLFSSCAGGKEVTFTSADRKNCNHCVFFGSDSGKCESCRWNTGYQDNFRKRAKVVDE